MKNTALSHIHEGLGAKMVEFAGYSMPVQYEGVNVEHETVREGVGVFDVSHMGEFFLKGPKALDLIQKVTSNDASKLSWVMFLGTTVQLAVFVLYLLSSFNINSSVCSWRIFALNSRSLRFFLDMVVSLLEP